MARVGTALVALTIAALVAAASPAATQDVPPPGPPDATRVFAVSHNSGRSLAMNARALAQGADIIEIDVRSLRGQLVSSHYPILVVGELRMFLGPTVEEVWNASTGADAIQLDLKESSDGFVALVITFLRKHAGEHPVMVASADAATLARLVGVSPDVVLFLSVHDSATLIALTAQSASCLPFGGVTVREELLDAGSIDRLHAAGLLTFAWTVNDQTRADELVRLGVDGIITGNLQLLEQLGGAQPNERSLLDARPPVASACA